MSLRVLMLVGLLTLPALVLAEPVRLFVTVAPLAWLVEQIGGEQVTVNSLVRPGQDPHGFEPSPRQLGQLQRASAYLSLGLPFEQAWLPRMVALNPQLRIVRLTETEAGEAPPQAHRAGHEHGHDHGGADPHVWTDPVEMQEIAKRVSGLLSELAPEHAALFAARQVRLHERLATLDRDMAARFAGMRDKVFLVHHPAWGHLAERYGLTQLTIEREGKEPGPRALAALVAEVRAHGIRILFVEPQASEHLARGLADSLKLEIVPLDPLAADYEANMRAVAGMIVESQR